jgi:CDP-diacylglycerol--serine O-phosphatidyltransferase
MQRIRTVAVFPTMLTLGNLVCGFFAIVVAARVEAPVTADTPQTTRIEAFHPFGSLIKTDPVHNTMLAGWLIFIAMIFDALDGYVARLARSTSDFGAQLDSLCDLVTFGVAPAFLLVKICPHFVFEYTKPIWVIAASFVVCVALRLARFNVETGEEDDHRNFNGLPCPAAAATIGGFAILFYTLRRENNSFLYAAKVDDWMQYLVPGFAVLLALLMVSRIPYPHVVNQVIRGRRSFGHVVVLVFGLAAMMVVPGYTVPIVCCAFVVIPPLRYIWQRMFNRQAQEEPLF